MNLDDPSDFNMEAEEVFTPQFDSFNGVEEPASKKNPDSVIEDRRDSLLNMDVDMEENTDFFCHPLD